MQYIIFGAGNNAFYLIKSMEKSGYRIKGIIDNDHSKHGKMILGHRVECIEDYDVEELKRNFILVSIANQDSFSEVKKQLECIGLSEGKHFACGLGLIDGVDPISGHTSGYIDLSNLYSSIKTYDPSSRLIVLKAEKRIFRGVTKSDEHRYREVFEQCHKNGLIGEEIVNTWISDEGIDLPYDLIFEHEFIEPVTYDFEWPPHMFKDYVIFMCEFIRKMAESDLCLIDGHALNVTVNKGHFVFIDFGALGKGLVQPRTLVEFLNTHLIPLILIIKNEIDKAYLYLKNPGITYTLRDIKGYMTEEEIKEVSDIYDLIPRIADQISVIYFADKVKEFIEEQWDIDETTRWAGYQNDEWEWSSDKKKWSEKMKNVVDDISRVKPDTIVDIAGNMGWYGASCRKSVKYSVIVDIDYSCVDNLWNRVKNQKMDNVIPVYMSFCAPTMDYYRDEMISKGEITPWRKSAVSRFKSELVLALAVVHHLAFAQQLTFEEIIGQLNEFSERYLIIEFIEKEDRYITDFIKTGFDWYNKYNFEKALQRYFKIIDISESTPKETRYIYLCEKG